MVDAEGNFTVTLTPAYTQGGALTVKVVDGAGNASTGTSITAADLLAPDAPTGLSVAANNGSVSGKGEAGATAKVYDAKGKELGSAVVDADGNFTVALTPAYTQGGALTVKVVDGAGNASTGTSITAADILAPDAPTALSVAANNGSVSGKGEAGATAKVYDAKGKELGSAVVDADGNFTVALTPAYTQGGALTVKVVDSAGNASTASSIVARDIAAPDPATELTLSAKNDILSGRGEAGASVTVRDGAGKTIGSGIVGSDGTFAIVLSPAYAQGGPLRVTLQDAAKNTSGVAQITAPDILAPEAPEDLNLNADNSVLTGTGEPLASVTVTNAAGTTIGTGTVNANGSFSIPLSPVPTTGGKLSVTLTDGANNTSDAGEVLAPNLNGEATVEANEVNAAMLVVPTSKPQATSEITSFAVATLGVSGVLNATALTFKNSLQFNVAEGTTRVMTFEADAGGVALLSKYNLRIMKQNASGDWETYATENAFLEVDLLGAVSGPYTVTLPPGNYAAVVEAASGVGLLVGYTLRTLSDAVFDFNDPQSISGEASGNVISDMGPVHGRDVLPEGSIVGMVDGTPLTENGPTVIEGTYGQLTMYANGSYSYALYEGQSGSILGKEETFTYVVLRNGDPVGHADLVIRLENSVTDVTRADAKVVMTVTPGKTDNLAEGTGFPKKTDFSVLELGLLEKIVDASAITVNNSTQFTVGEGQRRDITFDADGGGITLGGRYDLRIFKLVKIVRTAADGSQIETESWVDYYNQPDFLKVNLGGRADEVAVSFTEGTYAVVMSGSAALSLLKGSSLWATSDYTYDFDAAPSYVQGETSGTLAADGQTIVVKTVEGATVAATGETVVAGEFGELTIKADGSYSYRVYGPQDGAKFTSAPFGEIENFTYTATIDGKPRAATLRLAIDAAAQQELVGEVVVNMVSKVDVLDVPPVVHNVSTTTAGSFNVTFAEGTLSSLRLVSDVKYDVKNSSHSVGYTYKLEREIAPGIWEQVTSGTKAKAVYQNSLDVDFGSELVAGTYRVSLTITDRASAWYLDWSASLEGQSTYLAETQLADEPANGLSGTLVALGVEATHLTTLTVDGKTLTSGTASELKSMTITGDHGTLVVREDGAYSYTASGKSFGDDVFSYQLGTVGGSTVSSTLTIHVGQNLVTSGFDDVAYNTAGLDIFTTGEGADVVSFKVFGEEPDVWTDFDQTEGDRLHISDLVSGLTAQNADSLVQLETVQFEGVTSTKVAVFDGADFHDLAVLRGVDVTDDPLDQLFDFTNAY